MIWSQDNENESLEIGKISGERAQGKQITIQGTFIN